MILVGADIKHLRCQVRGATRSGRCYITSVQIIIIAASLLFMGGCTCCSREPSWARRSGRWPTTSPGRGVRHQRRSGHLGGVRHRLGPGGGFRRADRPGHQPAADDGLHHHREGIRGRGAGRAGQRLRRHRRAPSSSASSENLGVWYIPPVWKDSIAYGILILVLFFRPAGSLARRKNPAACFSSDAELTMLRSSSLVDHCDDLRHPGDQR